MSEFFPYTLSCSFGSVKYFFCIFNMLLELYSPNPSSLKYLILVDFFSSIVLALLFLVYQVCIVYDQLRS